MQRRKKLSNVNDLNMIEKRIDKRRSNKSSRHKKFIGVARVIKKEEFKMLTTVQGKTTIDKSNMTGLTPDKKAMMKKITDMCAIKPIKKNRK